MTRCLLICLLLSNLLVSACTPMGAASVVGSTLSRTIEIEQNKKQREPANRRIAITNVNVGVGYMRQGSYERALTKFNRAKEADPDYPLTYNMLGVLYQMLDQPEPAEENFKHSIKLSPDDASALNNYGQFLCKQDREDEAETLFLEAAANPFYQTPELAYANAGSCAQLHGNTEKARDYFQKSLSENPNMPVALSNMSEIHFDESDFVQAREYMNRYLKVASHNPKTLWLAIRIERQFGDLDKIASYSLLLRNKYPDTREAELLRISEEYTSSVKPAQMIAKQQTPPVPGAADTQARREKTNFEVLRLYDSSKLLVEFDLSTYPTMLDVSELVDYE